MLLLCNLQTRVDSDLGEQTLGPRSEIRAK